jgi:hypothetical protein
MVKKPAKMANRKKGDDQSKPLVGKARIGGDVCVGFTVFTNHSEENGKVVGDAVHTFEHMWDAINLRDAINSGRKDAFEKFVRERQD